MTRVYGLCLLLCFHLFAFHPALLPAARGTEAGFRFSSQSEYWPTTGWKRSDPEAQGMNSGLLSSMFREINRGNYYINSVVVVKNGYLVAEGDRNEPGHLGPIWSSTKTITSALAGIALARGVFKSVDQPVVDFFPRLLSQNDDPRKGRMQVRHLLAMTSGFDWPETESSMAYHGNPEYQMEMSPDWTAYVLGRPMAKIGYLYLKGGHWDGRQIIPEKWVKASTRKQSAMNWKGFVADDYGYGWYLQSYGFHTLGYQGQYIFVLPDIETVVVFTAELALHELELPVRWVETYILPAAYRSDAPPEKDEAELNLSAEINRFNTTPYW